MQYKNITIIGTSHIAPSSIKEVKDFIENKKPDIVAIELDRGRYNALTKKAERASFISLVFRIGITGTLFAVIGAYVQNKLGKMIGVEPGADMLSAINAAKKQDIPIYLIDRNIEITLARFSQAFSWKEKFRIIADIFLAVFFKETQIKKYGLDKIDLSNVPSKQLISKMMLSIKKRYPSIYRVLIEERNEFMVKMLVSVSAKNPDKTILAVVGAGHEEGMMNILKRTKINVVV